MEVNSVRVSGLCTVRVCPFRISSLLVGMGIYKLGQQCGSCDNHCDLLHHKAGEERVAGSFPRDAKSAGLDWDGACLQVADSMSSWTVENLFTTNILYCWMVPWSMWVQWRNVFTGWIHWALCGLHVFWQLVGLRLHRVHVLVVINSSAG